MAETPEENMAREIIYFGDDENAAANQNGMVVFNGNSLKIWDLNEFCLEKIFQYLEMADLAIAAESNVPSFPKVAKNVFIQKYQDTGLYFESINSVTIYEYHSMTGEPLFKGEFWMIGIIFKHFGVLMHKIKLFHDFVMKNAYSCHLMIYIREYCPDYLIELHIVNPAIFNEFLGLNIKFRRVEKLIFTEVKSLGRPIANLNEMFPNLRFLEFHNVKNPFENVLMEGNFPHLQHFGIFTYPYTTFLPSFLPNTIQLLNMNPQLTSLSMFDMTTILNNLSMDTMPNIKRLQIGGELEFPRPPFNFENLISMKLFFANYENDTMLHSQLFPPHLEELDISGFKLDQRYVDLVLQCKNLRKLRLTFLRNLNNLILVEQLALNLTHLVEVEFVTMDSEKLKLTTVFTYALKFMEKGASLRKAIASFQVEKEDVKIGTYKYYYLKQNDYLAAYQTELDKILPFDKWRWPIKHETKYCEYLQGYAGGPVFSVTMKRIE